MSITFALIPNVTVASSSRLTRRAPKRAPVAVRASSRVTSKNLKNPWSDFDGCVGDWCDELIWSDDSFLPSWSKKDDGCVGDWCDECDESCVGDWCDEGDESFVERR